MHCFSLSIEHNIAHLVLNQPEALNTMHPTFWRELDEVLTKLHKEAPARVLVISSRGKHFSAGMALETFAGAVQIDDQSPQGRAALFDLLTDMQATFTKLETLRMPVIAAIQGGCIGGAVDMVSACCLRYATTDAFFCIQEINIGMTADVGTFPRLCKLIPEGWVREMAYTGRRLPAAKAKEIGLVNEVFDTHEALLAHALATAREIASKAPLAVAGSKVMMNYARDHTIADGLDYIATWQTGMFSGAHMAEAFRAKHEKRAANFPDLQPLRTSM